jgi:hypothetical protein
MIIQSQPTIPYEIHQSASSLEGGLAQARHKDGYELNIAQPVKVSTQDMPDTLPKDHKPDISSKVTVAFAVEEWFQICLTYLNYERSKTSKVLMPLPRAILSD